MKLPEDNHPVPTTFSKILAQAEANVVAGRTLSQDEVFASIRQRLERLESLPSPPDEA